MNIKIDLKPLSVNKAWKGRRYKTVDYLRFERDLSLILPLPCPELKNCLELKLTIKFGVKSIGSDLDNLVKPLLDCLVKRGIIKDDRYIYELHLFKFKSSKDSIEILIEKIK
jgi:Holliday junction resolvase RusA-like endonuclease